jgi:hypothetical protein
VSTAFRGVRPSCSPARRLRLESHWAVNSSATVKLVTAAIAEFMSNPKIARAGVLCRLMLTTHENFMRPVPLTGRCSSASGMARGRTGKAIVQFKAGCIIIAVREFHLLGRAQESRDNDPEFD